MATDALLAKAGLSRPPPLPPLSPPFHTGPRRALPVDHVEARDLLAIQRRQSQPASDAIEHPATTTTTLRNILSIKRPTPRLGPDHSTSVFTLHEVAACLDSLLGEEKIKSVGVAQAVLLHAGHVSLHQLWQSRPDAELEQHTRVQWLNNVTSRADIDYVSLLCEMGATPDLLSAAFRIAFGKSYMNVMELLLSYGADASSCQAGMRKRMRPDKMELIQLLLAAPCALPDAFWQACLDPCDTVAPAVLLQCLSHRPSLVNERMLAQALGAQRLETAAILLAFAAPSETARFSKTACSIVSKIDVPSKRHDFFELLHAAGCLSNNSILRNEVMEDVKKREMRLVHLLVKAGVTLDVGSENAIKWAVTHMDLQMLDVLCTGTLENAAAAMDWIPKHASEQDSIRLLDMLATFNLAGDPLHRRLIVAVHRQHTCEAQRLIRLGASVDYKQAAALHTTIRKRRFPMFDTLLQADCSPQTMSSLIPALVEVQDRQKRFAAMEKVLDKGALPESLGRPLEILLAEAGEADFACIQLLLRHGASPDVSDQDSTNSVLVAVRTGHLRVLRALCEATIRPGILSRAVLIAFLEFSSGAHGHDAALETIRLLLTKGASGIPIDRTLLSAVTRGSCMDVVKLLLSFGADTNHAQGEAFLEALTSKSLGTFEILCERCPPNLASTERLMPLAINPRYYEPTTLEVLLKYTRHKRAALDIVTEHSLQEHPNMTAILRCLLPHGLCVNSGDCRFLSLAVFAEDVDLLRDMLAAKPNETCLRIAFEAAVGISVKQTRVDVMTLLLEQAAGAEIGQTACISEHTQLAIDGDGGYEELQLTLHHGARVDHQEGIAVQMAAAAGHLEVLRLLLIYRPAVETIKHACLASLRSFAGRNDMPSSAKSAIYVALLDASANADSNHLSDLLDASLQCMPTEVQFPALLLSRGAKVHDRTIRAALGKASDDLLVVLTSRFQSSSLFQLVSRTEMPEQRRVSMLNDLLKHDFRQTDMSRALLYSLDTERIHDLTTAKLLLKHGADASFQSGKAFKLAIEAESVTAVRLLSAYITTHELANAAFFYVVGAAFRTVRTRFDMYQSLLDGNLVSRRNCYLALYECLDHHGADLDTIRLLLKSGADPDAACFLSACRVSTTEQFRELCKHADLNLVVQALVSNFENEGDAAKWLKLCLEEQPRSAKVTNSDLLFDCMRKYPDGETVLTLILKRGIAVSPEVSHSILPGWAKERCSILIWALLATPKVSNKTVLKLLDAGFIDIDHETETSQLSATLACLLDISRTPVLRALLRMSKGLVAEHQVSVSALARLGAHPEIVTPEHIHDLGTPTLRMASLYLGNIEAFKVLDHGQPSEESLLHLAALLGLPKFVKEFLGSYSPNLVLEEYKNYTPLAVAIYITNGPPWCKIANAEAPFHDRRKETIKLLAPRSDLSWRFRKMTYVHMALHEGPQTTDTLLDALAISNDANRFERLVYEDKAQRRYTPGEYVRELMGIQLSEQRELLACLAKANLLTGPERAAFNAGR